MVGYRLDQDNPLLIIQLKAQSEFVTLLTLRDGDPRVRLLPTINDNSFQGSCPVSGIFKLNLRLYFLETLLVLDRSWRSPVSQFSFILSQVLRTCCCAHG